MKIRTKWAEEIELIQQMLSDNIPLREIGEYYGVSKQRMYQVLEKFGLKTLERTRKSFLRDKSPGHYWLNHILVQRGISKNERIRILENIVVPDICPILKIPLNYGGTGIIQRGKNRTENSPSVDQVDPGKGYHLENIAIISWRANRIKNDGTAKEHLLISQYINKFKKNKELA